MTWTSNSIRRESEHIVGGLEKRRLLGLGFNSRLTFRASGVVSRFFIGHETCLTETIAGLCNNDIRLALIYWRHFSCWDLEKHYVHSLSLSLPFAPFSHLISMVYVFHHTNTTSGNQSKIKRIFLD